MTVAVAARQADPGSGRAASNALYAEAVSRHGAEPIVLDARRAAGDAERCVRGDGRPPASAAAPTSTLPGTASPSRGSTTSNRIAMRSKPRRGSGAQARALPVLGLCRGFQAINVFSGGTLLQHVDGHRGRAGARARRRPIRCGSRPGRGWHGSVPDQRGGGVLEVNSYHHQGVRAADLAPGLVANAWASSPAGELVEGFEAADGRFVFGLQCHPERHGVDARRRSSGCSASSSTPRRRCPPTGARAGRPR